MKKVVNYKAQKEEWEKAKDEAFKKISPKHKVNGFRAGKAPRNVFERNFPGQIMMEAADILVDKEYQKILSEGKILPILEPKIDIVKVNDNELEVNFTFILEPEVKLGEYKNLGLKKETVKVSKEEIDQKIEALLKEYTELVIKEDGPVAEGDIAIIDFEGFKDGIAFEGGKGENYSLEIGSKTFIPGFEEGIIGMKKGEEKDISLTFPEEYQEPSLAGQKVIFKVKVNEIKTKELPELNQDFFDDLGMEEIKTKEDLEKRMKEEIKKEHEEEAEKKYIDALLEKAVSNMEIELDEEIIEAEAKAMYNDFITHMQARGINEELYLKYTNSTKENIINSMKKEAETRVKNSYLLNAIIKEEKIDVTADEETEKIQELAKKYNMTEEDVRTSFGGKEAFIYDIKVRKALDLMK